MKKTYDLRNDRALRKTSTLKEYPNQYSMICKKECSINIDGKSFRFVPGDVVLINSSYHKKLLDPFFIKNTDIPDEIDVYLTMPDESGLKTTIPRDGTQKKMVYNPTDEEIQWVDDNGGGGGSEGDGEYHSVAYLTDISSTGIISPQYLPGTAPNNKVISSFSSDKSVVNLRFELDPGSEDWQPSATANGVTGVLTQISPFIRRFYVDFANVNIASGEVHFIASDGFELTIPASVAGPAPEIFAINIGPNPGSQTTLKLGDSVQVTGTTEPLAFVQLVDQGIFESTTWVQADGAGNFSINGSVSGRTGSQYCFARARNSFGTISGAYQSAETRTLDQARPIFNFTGVRYPLAQGALKNSESAFVDLEILDASSVNYNCPTLELSITGTTIYQPSKTVQRIAGNYNDNTNNFSVTAYKASNGSLSTFEAIVEIAHIAPDIVLMFDEDRFRSSPSGEDTEITLLSDQLLQSAPNLSAPIGTLTPFTGVNDFWVAALNIRDDDPKGTFNLNSLVATNKAGVSQTLLADPAYEVGGFVERMITIPSFAHLQELGTIVTDTSKLSCRDNANEPLAYKTNKDNEPFTYSISDQNGILVPAGIDATHFYWTDQNAVEINSTGTATIYIEELV